MTLSPKPSSKTTLTQGPRHVDGTRALFLERLVTASEMRPVKTYDVTELGAAIGRSCGDILSVRMPQSSLSKPHQERTILDYGIPSLEQFAPGRHDDLIALANQMQQAIAAFEPRLADPSVEVIKETNDHRGLVALIRGKIKTGKILEPFEFALPLSASDHSHNADEDRPS